MRKSLKHGIFSATSIDVPPSTHTEVNLYLNFCGSLAERA